MSLLTAQARAQTYLYNQAGLGTGNQPSGMTAADFNQDGHIDLAVTNQLDNTVSVILSKSNGTFALRTDYPVGTAPMAVANADFNDDGILDLAVVNNQDNTVSILLGTGGGKFGKQSTFPTGTTPIGIVAADFNGDGKLDLAVLNSGTETISILPGNGDGTFGTAGSVDSVSSPIGILTGDLNGDGAPDIVTFDAAGYISILLNNRNGNFNASSLLAGNSAAGMAACDLNNDGKLDLLMTDPADDAIRILIGNGDGTFAQKGIDAGDTLPNKVDPLSPVFIACGDFNGDGSLDLGVSGSTQTGSTYTAIYSGNGDGTFGQGEMTPSPSAFPTVLLAADFNNDNYSDLAALVGGVNVALISLGAALPDHADIPLSGPLSTYPPAGAADFNGDGKLDAGFIQASQNYADGTFTGFMTVLPGNGDGTFGSPITTQLPEVGLGPFVVGDFNGDGKPDIAMSQVAPPATGTLAVAFGNGDGTFGSPVSSVFGPANSGVQALAGADFNGDGKTDLVAAIDAGTSFPVYILLNKGDGTFTANLLYSSANGVFGLAVADFNHDGKPDFAISSVPGQALLVFLGKGDGTFSAPASYTLGASPSEGVIEADFNGDGNPDLMVPVSNSPHEGVIFFAGNGDGSFKPGAVSATPTIGGPVSVGDFNGDGKPDVGFGGSAIDVGNGDGTLQSPDMFAFAGETPGYLVGDFNNDGSLDLMQLYSPISVVTAAPPSARIWLSSPAVSLSAQHLNLSSQGGAQAIALTNVGNGKLSIRNIAASTGFSETNNCPGTLNVGQGCTLNVSFVPLGTGAVAGSLTLSDNAYPGTQIVPLIGSTGTADFGLLALSSSATVNAGSSASYGISILGIQGFSGTIQLSCNGAPTQAACALSRSTASIFGNTPETVMLSVSTTVRTAAALTRPAQRSRATLAGFLIPGVFFLGSTLLFAKRRGWAVTIAISLTVTAMIGGMIACGGGGAAQVSAGNGGSSGGTTPSGTPAGTYTLTIGATSGSLSHSATVSLTVK